MHPNGAQCLHPHTAFFYRDDDEYLEGLRRFFAPALADGDPVAAALPKSKLGLARQALEDAGEYELLDMEELGRNPGRIIPAVERMLEKHEGWTLHYVGEPIWPGRSPAEIREAVRHEALINLAWPGACVRVLCPYDMRGLDEDVLRNAEQTHSTLDFGGDLTVSANYMAAPPPGCDQPFIAPPQHAVTLEFGRDDLGAIRALAVAQATRAGFITERVDDLKVVANELASNAVRHGQAPRAIAIWPEDGTVVCEVTSRGAIADPLAGRRTPRLNDGHGMGLWIVHQLSELVEVRSGEHTTVRAHIAAA